MKDDPTISRIRKARKKISARFGHNTEKLVRHYMKLQEKHKHKLIKTSLDQYEGFIARQNKEVERFKHIEYIKISRELNYDEIPSLSKEIREKLKRFAPISVGQANRISGVTPAAITILMVYLQKFRANKVN